MIDGRVSGSGKYSYHEASKGRFSVFVSHMPEDFFEVRIVFRHLGQTDIPTFKISDIQAELLWSSLNRMAIDLKWEDKGPGDK